MQKGFTLLELLFITVIIGVLAAMSVINYSSYRRKAYDGASMSDLVNISRCQEAYYLDNEAYGTCTDAECETTMVGFRKSADVHVSTYPDAFGGFIVESTHPKGTTNLRCCYFSLGGGFAGCDTIPSCLAMLG